jgi:hypothetical protein
VSTLYPYPCDLALTRIHNRTSNLLHCQGHLRKPVWLSHRILALHPPSPLRHLTSKTTMLGRRQDTRGVYSHLQAGRGSWWRI